jgi:dGTPase
MDWADDVAYSVHDVEDGVVAGRVDLDLMAHAEERARVAEHVRDWYGAWYSADAVEAAIERLADYLRGEGYLLRAYDGSRRSLASLKDMTSQLIGRFVGAAVTATRGEYGDGPLTRYAARLMVPEATELEILALKGIAVTYVMAPRGMEPRYEREREILTDLVHVLTDRPDALEPSFAADWKDAADDAGRLRVVIDQVASLTDLSALALHARLTRQGS